MWRLEYIIADGTIYIVLSTWNGVCKADRLSVLSASVWALPLFSVFATLTIGHCSIAMERFSSVFCLPLGSAAGGPAAGRQWSMFCWDLSCQLLAVSPSRCSFSPTRRSSREAVNRRKGTSVERMTAGSPRMGIKLPELFLAGS